MYVFINPTATVYRNPLKNLCYVEYFYECATCRLNQIVAYAIFFCTGAMRDLCPLAPV